LKMENWKLILLWLKAHFYGNKNRTTFEQHEHYTTCIRFCQFYFIKIKNFWSTLKNKGREGAIAYCFSVWLSHIDENVQYWIWVML
jgi:hypothetical protein